MRTHFSPIGMTMASIEELEAKILRAAEHAETINCKNGRYLHWTSDGGAELWIQEDKHGNVIGATPYFRGKSEIRVGVIEKITRPDYTPLEGAIYGWVDPQENDPNNGIYAFMFDLIDKGIYEPFDFPFISPVHLCAFAQELNIYNSDKDYYDSTDGSMNSEAFIPSIDDPPKSNAMIAGHILEANQIKNPLTNKDFYWMRIKTYGGEIDLVSDLELVLKSVIAGGVIEGVFWLRGRILKPKFK